MQRTFVASFCIAACLASVSFAADGPTPISKITGNVKAQLIAAKTSETRSQFLIARFKTVNEPAGREIEVHFRGSSTTHDATLLNLVKSCIAGGKPLPGQPKTLSPANAWTASTVEAFFSIPKDGARDLGPGNLKDCYFLSFRVQPQEK